MLIKKIRHILSSALMLVAVTGVFALGPAKVALASPVTCPDGVVVDKDAGMTVAEACAGHEGINNPEPALVKNDCNGPGADLKAGEALDSANHCAIFDYLLLFINILSALVGVAIAASIIYGGIQYSSAGGDPQKVSAAKRRIFGAVIALAVYTFMFAFLQYIVPGGVF